jgi:hypothetical protein
MKILLIAEDLLATQSKLSSNLEINKPRSKLALLVAEAEGKSRSTHHFVECKAWNSVCQNYGTDNSYVNL